MGEKNKNNLTEITSLNKGLESLNIDLFEFINSPPKIKFEKNTESIINEFEVCKYQKLYELVKDEKDIKLDYIEKLNEGNLKLYAFCNGEHLFVQPRWLREKNITELNQGLKYLSKELEIKSIVELGAGYGSKIIALAKLNKKNEKLKFKALDISKNGLFCCRELARRENIFVETKMQNFLIKPRMKEFIDKNSIIITSYNLHYWKNFNINNIKEFIEDGIDGGIHIEPCSNLLLNLEDKIYAAMALKYIKINNYTEDISLAFKQAQEEKIINFKILKNVRGFGLLPAWTFIWHKRI